MLIVSILVALLLLCYMERITNNIHSTNLLLRDLNNSLNGTIRPLIEEISSKIENNKAIKEDVDRIAHKIIEIKDHLYAK